MESENKCQPTFTLYIHFALYTADGAADVPLPAADRDRDGQLAGAAHPALPSHPQIQVNLAQN